MKKLLLLVLPLIITGCGKSAFMDQQLSAYNNAMAVYQQATAAKASQPPMVSVSFHPDGRLASMQVAQRIDYPDIQLFRPTPHPGWALGGTAVRAAGTIGGIFAGGWAISELSSTIADAAGTHYNGNINAPVNSTGNFSPYGQYSGGDGIFNPIVIGGDGIATHVPIQPNAPIEIGDYNPPEIPEEPLPEEPLPESALTGGQFRWSD